jgi:PA14 domain
MLLVGSAHAQTIITNILKRELWPAWTRFQVTTNINTNTGNATIVSTNITFPTGWDIEDNTANYGARYTGLVIPAATGLYDFYVASDDDTDLYISTNFSPTNKYMIAQELGWSPRLSWITIGGGGSVSAQKCSATFTNGLGATPHAGGISLVAGTRYHLEAIQGQLQGFGRLAVTMVPHLSPPLDGDPTVLTNSDGSGIAIIAVSITTPSVLNFTTSPTNKTVYPGITAWFRAQVQHNSQIPPTFQWQRGTVSGGVTNYVDIPNVTNGTFIAGGASSSLYSFVASTNDDGARFRCISKVPGLGQPVLVKTSSVSMLTVPASGGMNVPGRLKRELFSGLPTDALATITNGNNNVPSAVNTFLSFDVPTAGANYGERINGFFTPTSTDRYVFFLSSDDNSMLFVSTNDQPAGKLLVAQEDGWSDSRDWQAATSAGGSIAPQKRSDAWSPDGGITTPYSGGVAMTAGKRYYVEVVHQGQVANNHAEVTFATTNEVASGLPLNFDPTRLTNGVISYVTFPVSSFAITNQPSSVTRDEGLPYTFAVGVRTDSEVTPAYQWKKNGININGATAFSFTGIALTNDNGASFSCDISIPGVTNTTSSNAVLTVIQGVFAGGILKREFWTNATARGITRQLVGANVGGTFPDADYTLYTPTLDITEDRANDYIQRVSGFFIPPVSTNYVFFLACDDDSDMYISTDEQQANKYMVAQETGWSNARQWLTPNAGVAAQKRSDQFNGGVYAAGIPLLAGQRYWLEIVHHEISGGDAVSATYIYSGETAPANFTLSQFGGSNIGVPVPPYTVLTITTNPENASTFVWQPVYFHVGATNNGLILPTYQWRRNSGAGFTNVPGAIAAFYGFVTSSNDHNAQFDCIVFAPGEPSLTKTSTVASLTVQAGGSLVTGSLDQERWNTGVSSDLIEAGGLGPADVLDIVTNVDFGQVGASFANRVRGFFIPPATTNYVFFICSDNNSDLFLSTDDQPSHKRLVAQEQVYTNPQRTWSVAVNGDPALKNSRTWSPDGGITTPYSTGIPLTVGQRYYIEIVHSETGGLDNLGATYKMFDEPDPADSTPSIMSGSVIGHAAAPAAVIPPTLTVTQVGGTVTVSWTPAGGTLKSTTSLSPPVTWNTVGTINPTNLVIGPGNLFLRVSVP